MDRAEVNIENSDCESGSEGSDHGNNALVVKPKATRGSSSSRSVAGGQTIDKYYKPPSIEESASMTQRGINLSNKVQTALTTQKREEKRGGIELVSTYVSGSMKLAFHTTQSPFLALIIC